MMLQLLPHQVHIISQDLTMQDSQGSPMAYDESFFLPLRNENLWLQWDRSSTYLCLSEFPAYFAYNSK